MRPLGPPSELSPGRFRFKIDAKIGQGASATVFRATDVDSNAPVAIKVGLDENEAARLAEEAALIALSDAPGVASVADAGRIPTGVPDIEAGRPYLALEWVDGAPLNARALESASRERRALRVATDIGRALAALHSSGVSHGDVKPPNVVVGYDARSRATLIDLGLGAPTRDATPVGGTLRYLAPESFDAAGSDGRTRDLWALGVLLAEVGSADVAEAADIHAALPLRKLSPNLEAIVGPLLSQSPAARPSAEWVTRIARDFLGEEQDEAELRDERTRAVRRTYLAVRRAELFEASTAELRVEGAPGEWLASAVALIARLEALRGRAPSPRRVVLHDLDSLGRARWLTALVGSTAAHWPVVGNGSDAEIAERLLRAARQMDPRSITLGLLETGTEPGETTPTDPVALAIALGRRAPAPAILDSAERIVLHDGSQLALALALGRALRLRGEVGRALTVLTRVDAPEARAELAECARRVGDYRRAESTLRELKIIPMTPRVRAQAAATEARIALDAGRLDLATSLVDSVAATPGVLEVTALIELKRGNLGGARFATERARVAAETDEERARAEAIAGNVAHAAGDAAHALDAFRLAVDHATRAGATLEEATYLTGVAAAGFDAGSLGEALEAATRATLLFEHLGRTAEAGRCLLSRAAVFAAAGSAELARDAAREALARATIAGDTRCSAFAYLTLADAAGADATEGIEHARRAAELLAGGDAGDVLRAAARRLSCGDDVPITSFDRIAEDPETSAPARLEWWSARADVLLRARSAERPDLVLGALARLAGVPAPMSTRGEAFSRAATLAARAGDGDAVRRFAIATAEAARAMLRGAPSELRTAISALPWANKMLSPRETAVLPEQIADVESLVHALGARDRLRSLLDQILDALVLWTGVERGLLLLRAPGDRLVPRAARNIAREDLSGTQLALSRSLAERALRTGDPVVAVDATGELSEVHDSVHALKLRSVLAVPLFARGQALGVVYLDDRIRRGAFGPSELAWVRLVAALAAVAIADARRTLELRRAARRARRAEARASILLAQREAELDVTARELARIREERATRYVYDDIIGESEVMKNLLALVDRVTPTEVPVLIAGESGSGKELVARAIHENGPRSEGPFVTENCGAIPEGLLESTLFGHVRGAFTGANRPHAGLFEIASGGTLFLDEIGEMTLGMQTKLLRVLEDGEVRPVGSERTRSVNVRIIAASHRDLAAMIDAGEFRRDLFYRLNVIRVDVPPLRARPRDIDLLVRHFVSKHAGKRRVRVSRAALDALSSFAWPGNVRQLENEVRRALVLADETITPEHLSEEIQRAGTSETERSDGLNVRRRLDALEADLVRTALERTAGNQTRAAELLGLSRFGLQKMIRRLGIDVLSASGQA